MNCDIYVKLNNSSEYTKFTESEFIAYCLVNNIKIDDIYEQLKKLKDFDLKAVKFSLDQKAQILQKLDETSKNISIKHSEEVGEDFELSSSVYTPQQFMNSGLFTYDGYRIPIPRKDEKNYIKYKAAEILVNEGGLTIDQAEKLAEGIVKNWDEIGSDAISLHKIFSKGFWYAVTGNVDKLREIFINEKAENKRIDIAKKMNPDDIIEVGNTSKKKISILQDTINQINHQINTDLQFLRNKEDIKNSVRTNMTFTAPINGVEDKPLAVHIDRLYVDDEGNIHVYNYKFSSTEEQQWSSVKKENYKYEASMIKEVLAANGFNSDKVRVSFVPVYVKYSDDFKSIEKITLDPVGILRYTISNNRPVLTNTKYERIVRKYIQGTNVELKNISEYTKKANDLCQLLIPSEDLQANGIKVSAKTWIKQNRDKITSNITSGWDIQFDDEPQPIHVDDPEGKNKPWESEAVIEVVKQHLGINRSNTVVTSQLAEAIRQNYEKQTISFVNRKGFMVNAEYLQLALQKYFTYFDLEDGDKKERVYDWKLLKSNELSDANILLFQNRDGQIDIVIPSPFNAQELIPTRFGQTNILGTYLMDMQAEGIMKATYGNLEIFRALALLNEIYPNITGNKSLGEIKVVTPTGSHGSGKVRTISQMLPHFNKIIRYLNTIPGQSIKNNLQNSECIDPVASILYTKDILLRGELTDTHRQILQDNEQFDIIQNGKNNEARLIALQDLLDQVQEMLRSKSLYTIDSIKQALFQGAPDTKLLAQLYYDIVKAINYYSGIREFNIEDNISRLERLVLPQYANPDSNVRLVVNRYTKALDDTAKEFNEAYSPLKKHIVNFYEAMGYNTARAAVIGDSTKIFKNLYREDEPLMFKDPYDSSYQLSEPERKFLKIVLFHINKIKAYNQGRTFAYKNEDDSNLLNYIKENKITYFQVPLKRKSVASKRQDSIEKKTTRWKKELRELFRSPKSFIEHLKDKYVQNNGQSVSELDRQNDIDILNLSYRNPYTTSDAGDATRNNLINRRGIEYFETNLEDILGDYTEKYIISKNLTKALFEIKAIMLEMHILGEEEGHKGYEKSIQEIEDFIKLNFFNGTIMDKFEEKAMAMLSPAKQLMSRMYIAGNIKSAFRDFFEGVWQNFSRTATHFQTDLQAKYVGEAYKDVIANSFKSDRDINLISELCLRYRLSNVDVAKIAERAKASRGGVYNIERWEYSTLRGPDFLNRMVLFTARCKQDGVWDGWYFDSENRLKYNWKKDKRFDKLARGLKDDPEYAKQKGMYMTRVKIYNSEHPEANISYNLDAEQGLPEPYTQDEIKQFIQVSNNIYGAYDKSQRAKLENMALGQAFCAFSTWMNGHIANWLRRPGEYSEYFKFEQARHPISNNLLYFTNDGNVVEEVINEDGTKKLIDPTTGEELDPMTEIVPVFDKIPIQVQGILYTLKDTVNVLLESNNIKEDFKNKVWDIDINRQNFTKLSWDLFMVALFTLLFKLLLTPEYEKHKKEADPEALLQNGFIEVLYKASHQSYDGFKGPIAVADYVLGDTNPMAINASLQLTRDIFEATFGKQTVGAVIRKDVPIVRAFSATHKRYFKYKEAYGEGNFGGGGSQSQF